MNRSAADRGAWRGLLAALLGLLLPMAGTTGASAASPPTQFDVTMSFTGVLPGQTQTRSAALELPFRAKVSDVLLREDGPTGAVAWDARLCQSAPSACIDLMADAPSGDVLAAGTQQLVVSVTGGTLRPGRVSTLIGRVSVVRADDLAMTGVDAVASVAALALALAAVGGLLVALARRRRDEEDASREVPTC